ncbi:MAG: ADP-glyceromanno-heptose 6-epimerase [Alphaproteobacteria bacterium]|nr:ADP-glyceromanno-heptose 6-epimerase [Alphaproteobacteria bacterium]
MIIVTGGAGFIGSALVAALAETKEPLVVCDWLGQDGKWHNIAKRELENIVPPEDLPEYLARHGKDVKAIFHMGAISSTTATDGDEIVQNNFKQSRDLWRWCAENRARFIYASSAATYGSGEHGFDDDDSAEHLGKLKPLNLYGWSKHLFDRWVRLQAKLGRKGPPQCAGLKFFNVFGPNEYHKGGQRSVAHQIHPFAVKGEAFPLFKSYRPDYKDGGQLRDFIWIGDVVKVMVWLYQNPRVSGLFNVGSGRARSFADMASAVYRAAGKEPMLTYREMPPALMNAYQYFTQAKMNKLREAGYSEPFTELEEGIRLYVQDYLAKPDPYI